MICLQTRNFEHCKSAHLMLLFSFILKILVGTHQEAEYKATLLFWFSFSLSQRLESKHDPEHISGHFHRVNSTINNVRKSSVCE